MIQYVEKINAGLRMINLCQQHAPFRKQEGKAHSILSSTDMSLDVFLVRRNRK